VVVVSTSKAARKRTGKLDQTCTQANMLVVFPLATARDRRWCLMEPLALPGVARHINKFLRKTTQKRGSGLAIHTNGLIATG